jgi:hypothetical protein
MRKYGIWQETELPMNETDRSYRKEPRPVSQTETSSYDSSDPTPTRKMAWICRSSRSSSCVRPISPYLPTLRGACTPRNCGPALLEELCKVEMGDSPATLGFRCGRPLSGTCASYLEQYSIPSGREILKIPWTPEFHLHMFYRTTPSAEIYVILSTQNKPPLLGGIFTPRSRLRIYREIGTSLVRPHDLVYVKLI